MDASLQNARWNILQEISKGPSTVSRIAKAVQTSVPNVSQQVKLLEAYGFIERKRGEAQGVGKPQQLYHLKKQVGQITYARQGFAEKMQFNPTGMQAMLLNILFVPKKEDQHCLLKMLLLHEDILQDCSVAYLQNKREGIEVLFLTEKLDEIRKNYSKIALECSNRKCNFIAWTHSVEEMNDGIAREDEHFAGMMSELHIIHDPTNRFNDIKR